MRLELEQNPTEMGFAGDVACESATDKAAEAANFLRDGIRAAQSGSRAAARTALLRAAELDPQSESAWMWLSSISEYPEELLAFLTNVLEINPRNARALEWSAATRSLLAKNLIQRGIDAAEAEQKDLAVQHFNQALEHDERSSMAWLWLASLCESYEGKLSYLEKVLEFDPENETALAGYKAARDSIREGLLTEARAAAVTGDTHSANELLDAVIAEEPDAEDAWVLKSHIAAGFEEKIAAFRRVLEINPDNGVARSGLDSLTAIMDAVGARSQVEEAVEAAVETVEEVEASAVEEAGFEVEEAADEEIEAFAEEVRELESSVADEAAEGFDNDDEAQVDFNGTMLMTATDLDVDLENAGYEEDEAEAADQPEAAFADTDEVPQFSTDEAEFEEYEEPEAEESLVAQMDEVTHELASEAPDAHFDEVEAEPEAAEVVAFPVLDRTEELPVLSAMPVFGEEEPISAPAGNPFDAEAFRNEPYAYDTVLSVEAEPEYLPEVEEKAENTPWNSKAFDAPFDSARYSGTIPMPDGDLDKFDAPKAAPNRFETRIVRPVVDAHPVHSTAACPFCSTENEVQSIACNNCLAVLTLDDLELILANHHADKRVVLQAVEAMEREKNVRELTEAELTMLVIGHLNLRNLQFGYDYLHEAAQKNPNNVVLTGQANSLLIRLDEIRQQDEVHEAMAKGKKILVVDDSPTVRKLIAGKLEKCGHAVFCSGDGVEAMDQLSTLRPDLILLDITMPRMDGYQVCKLIRGNPETQDTPVVMISGKDGFFDKVRGRMAGASGYITKPFGPETLMKAVESYLSPAN